MTKADTTSAQPQPVRPSITLQRRTAHMRDRVISDEEMFMAFKRFKQSCETQGIPDSANNYRRWRLVKRDQGPLPPSQETMTMRFVTWNNFKTHAAAAIGEIPGTPHPNGTAYHDARSPLQRYKTGEEVRQQVRRSFGKDHLHP